MMILLLLGHIVAAQFPTGLPSGAVPSDGGQFPGPFPSGGPPSGGQFGGPGFGGPPGSACGNSNSNATAVVDIALQATCAALAGLVIPASSIGLPTSGAIITSASLVANTTSCSGVEYCKVSGVILPYNASYSVDGIDIPTANITFGISLPDPSAWNNRTLQQGGGGFDGSVPSVDNSELAEGYVNYGSDSGHTTTSQLFNDEAMRNFGREQIKKTHDVMKAVVNTYYGADAKHSYFTGGSQGGHESLIAATFYPEDYDGCVVGFPAYDLYLMHLANLDQIKTLYNVRVAGQDGYKYAANAGDGWISQTQLGNLTDAIVSACDALDGATDGIVSNPGDPKCAAFRDTLLYHDSTNPLRCLNGTATTGSNCWSDQQIETLTRFSSRYNNPSSLSLVNGLVSYGKWPYINGAHIVNYGDFGSSAASQNANAVMIASSEIQLIAQNTTVDLLSFDLNNYASRINYLSTKIDASYVNLTAFKAKGGKIIHYVGMEDVSISYYNSIDFYMRMTGQFNAASGYLHKNEFWESNDAVTNANVTQNSHVSISSNGVVNDFYTFYAIPGMGHGQGYYAASVDWLGAMVNWVENGVAPGASLVSNDTGSNNLGSRPVCFFPYYPKKTGSGANTDATQYSCAVLDEFANTIGAKVKTTPASLYVSSGMISTGMFSVILALIFGF